LANTFSRSSSTSTIVGDQPGKSSTDGGSISSTDPKDPNGIGIYGRPSRRGARSLIHLPTAASEAQAAAAPPPLRPGILIVTLHEGKDFSLPPGAEQAFGGSSHHSSVSQGGFSVAGSVRPDSRGQGGIAGSFSGSGRPQSAAGNINAAPTIHGRYSSKHLPYALVDFDKQQVFVNAVSGTPQNPLWAGASTQYKFDVSRTTDVTVSLYIRNPKAPQNAGRNEDIFIGTTRVTPRFEETQVDEAKKDKSSEQKPGQAGERWAEVQYGTGSVKIGVNFVENRQHSLKIEDFELLKVVGKGSFGKVMQVQYVLMGRVWMSWH
jgi:serum/glucocorticoid-regulated kinase 2